MNIIYNKEETDVDLDDLRGIFGGKFLDLSWKRFE